MIYLSKLGAMHRQSYTQEGRNVVLCDWKMLQLQGQFQHDLKKTRYSFQHSVYILAVSSQCPKAKAQVRDLCKIFPYYIYD